MYQTEQLKKQLEAQNSILESTETEKLRLTKQLQENLEEVRCVTEERDSLRRMEGTLKMEGDQLRESLREREARVSYTPTSSVFSDSSKPFDINIHKHPHKPQLFNVTICNKNWEAT